MYGINTNWDYKFVLNTFAVDPNDRYVEEKIFLLDKLRKKDISYLN